MIRLEQCEGDIEIEPHNNGLILTSNLKKCCPFCERSNCYFSCDASVVESEEGINPLVEDEEALGERRDFNFSIDGLQTLILNCADQGVDVESPQFQKAVQETVEAMQSKCLSH